MVVAEAAVLAAKGGKALMEVANQPVIGWTRIQSYDKGRKRPRHVEERTSVNVRAWEIGVIGMVAFVAWALSGYAGVSQEVREKTPTWIDSSSPFWPFLPH